MIAVRMCVTGHCQPDIESAVRQCAPAIRTPEQAEKHHNWDDYAQHVPPGMLSGSKPSATLKPLENIGSNGRHWKGCEIEIENVMEDNDREIRVSIGN